VAVAVPLLDGWYFAHVVAGAEAVFAEAGYDTIIVGIGAQGEGRHVLEIAGPIYRRVDGLICVDVSLTDDELGRLQNERMEVVYVGHDNDSIPCMGIDDVEVGRLATQHLIDLGHRRIALINGQPDDVLGFVVPHKRQQGYESAHLHAGLTPDPSLQMPGYFTIEGGYQALSRLLELPDPPTAVLSFSDEMAFGALWAARDRGVQVPHDLSIVGVDDHDLSVLLDLTTVHQDVAEQGALAARTMIELLAGREVPSARQNTEVRLIERGTTAAPRC
jgi:DNA-binding LacI/PurR family transcriptional regulator